MGNAATRLRDIRREFPVLARHEGTWEGTYRYYDADGRQVDEHRSRLECRFPETGPWPYHQTNRYTWADGRSETREFPASVEDGRLIWHGDLIDGWCAELDLDTHGRTVMLYWTRKNEPGIYLYEMIQLSDCGRHRARVWQWFRDGRLCARTLIDEVKVD